MYAKLLSDEEIRERFFALCARLGWHGPQEIARQLPGHQPDVTKWSKGVRPIPQQYLHAVVERAGESMAYFAPEEWPGRREKRDLLVAARQMEIEAEAMRRRALGDPTSEAADDPEQVLGQADSGEPGDTPHKQQGGGGGN